MRTFPPLTVAGVQALGSNQAFQASLCRIPENKVFHLGWAQSSRNFAS